MPLTQRRRRPADDQDSDQDERPRQRVHREERNEMDSENESDDHSDADRPEQSADEQLAKKLIRYAISCEYSRTAIRRDGIKERVLGNQGRSFKRIFALAQKQLKTVWGMELRELPVREKMSLQEKRQAMKSNSQPKTGSGAYILSSTLPDAYRSAAIVPPSKIPSSEDEATYVAFYTMIVSLIWLSGGELSEQKLRRCLMRLNADHNLSVEKTEVVLKRMERQGYVVRKVDRPLLGQDGDQLTTWHVGPRSREEIGLDGVMGMTREVYGDSDEDLETKLKASLGIKARPNGEAERGEEESQGGTSRRQTMGDAE